MNDDVFGEWKNQRFVTVESNIIDIAEGNIIILTDVEFWNDNYDNLKSWCVYYNAEVRGMTVTCDDATVTAFCLRWA
jgi:hypothetical protein